MVDARRVDARATQGVVLQIQLRSPNVTLKEEKMARRTVLTSRQRAALFCVPEREADLLRHYTLSDEGLENINTRSPHAAQF